MTWLAVVLAAVVVVTLPWVIARKLEWRRGIGQ